MPQIRPALNTTATCQGFVAGCGVFTCNVGIPRCVCVCLVVGTLISLTPYANQKGRSSSLNYLLGAPTLTQCRLGNPPWQLLPVAFIRLDRPTVLTVRRVHQLEVRQCPGAAHNKAVGLPVQGFLLHGTSVMMMGSHPFCQSGRGQRIFQEWLS